MILKVKGNLPIYHRMCDLISSTPSFKTDLHPCVICGHLSLKRRVNLNSPPTKTCVFKV